MVALFGDEGARNEWLGPLLDAPPARAGERRSYGVVRDPGGLLPASRSFLHYTGSLTAPPCTEGVEWVVLRAPITLSAAQLDAFAKLFPDNHRPLQPLGTRLVHQAEH
jgi:carbonic anhydrase